MPDSHPGPTGNFPLGQQGPDDRGELVLAIVADGENNLVAIEFGTMLNWFAMTPEQAISVGNTLINAAEKLEQGKVDGN